MENRERARDTHLVFVIDIQKFDPNDGIVACHVGRNRATGVEVERRGYPLLRVANVSRSIVNLDGDRVPHGYLLSAIATVTIVFDDG
jgi:hypothetical protein